VKRFIENDLLKWKESSRRKPLIVRGARQVGKTYSINKFGNEFFNNLVMVDLEKTEIGTPSFPAIWTQGKF